MGFPPASRAVTVIVDGLDPLLAVIVPGAAVTVDSAADTAPVVMSKVVLAAGARPPEAAPSEYPVPTFAIDRSENVATPDVADTVAVPVSSPPAGFAARDIVIGSAKLAAVFTNG